MNDGVYRFDELINPLHHDSNILPLLEVVVFGEVRCSDMHHYELRNILQEGCVPALQEMCSKNIISEKYDSTSSKLFSWWKLSGLSTIT